MSLLNRLAVAVCFVGLTVVGIRGIVPYAFATPVFGLATAPDGSLLVADAGAGIVELRKGVGSLVAALPGVTDIAPLGRGDMFATRGGGPGLTTGALFRVSRGTTSQIADLYAFEAAVNPHPTGTSGRTRTLARSGSPRVRARLTRGCPSAPRNTISAQPLISKVSLVH